MGAARKAVYDQVSAPVEAKVFVSSFPIPPTEKESLLILRATLDYTIMRPWLLKVICVVRASSENPHNLRRQKYLPQPRYPLVYCPAPGSLVQVSTDARHRLRTDCARHRLRLRSGSVLLQAHSSRLFQARNWALAKLRSDTDCDTHLGFDFLQSLRNHNLTLCGEPGLNLKSNVSSAHVRPLYVSSAIRLHSLPEEPGCGRSESHISVLENTRLTIAKSTANLSRRPVLSVACEDHELSQLAAYDRGGLEVRALGERANEEQSGASSCETWVEEDTVLVANPRMEYFGNYYHSMEEIFSIFETAFVLNRRIEDLRYVFLWERPGQDPALLQLPGQVGRSYNEHTSPPEAVPKLLDLWSKFIAGSKGTQTQYNSTMVALRPPRSAGPPLCFRRLILPMRACQGSILPATWATSSPCGHGNRVANAVAKRLRQAFGQGNRPRAVHKRPVVTMVSRSASQARHLVNEDEVVDALRRLASLPIVRKVHLEQLSINQQVEAISNTDLLIAPHGAGLTHLVELPEAAAVLELTPKPPPYPQRSVANIFANLAKWTLHPYKAVAASGDLDSALSVRAQEVARAADELLVAAGFQQPPDSGIQRERALLVALVVMWVSGQVFMPRRIPNTSV